MANMTLEQRFEDALSTVNPVALKTALDDGFDINSPSRYQGRTAFFDIVDVGNFELVEVALPYVKDIDHRDDFGDTVDYYARVDQNFDIANLIRPPVGGAVTEQPTP